MDEKVVSQLRTILHTIELNAKVAREIIEALPNVCVQPDHEIEACINCGKEVHTCEDPIGRQLGTSPENRDFTCPVHPDGVELGDEGWVCSSECWDAVIEEDEEYNSEEP